MKKLAIPNEVINEQVAQYGGELKRFFVNV